MPKQFRIRPVRRVAALLPGFCAAAVCALNCCWMFGQQPAAPAMQAPAITEEELKLQFQGKTFYLRDGYLENSLHFDTAGKLDGASPKASHTLSLVEIEQVHLQKHRVELEGVRYGLHFLGASATEDQTQAVEKVRLTTKKKPLRIAIDREVVVAPKKLKSEKNPKAKPQAAVVHPAFVQPEVPQTAEREDLKTTTSQDHANQALRRAINRVFSPGVDDQMIATLPDYWRLFYQAVADKADHRPKDAGVLRQSQVDTKARLLSAVEPGSNEYAQSNGVAGAALYHVVLGADGRPGTIAIGRPIGFGLDENAVDSIRRAKFQPALKDGKPVPVMLDVTVQFRIFSKRTAEQIAAAPSAPARDLPEKAALPGPYTARALQQQAEQQAAQQQAQAPAPPPATAPEPSAPTAPSTIAPQPAPQPQ